MKRIIIIWVTILAIVSTAEMANAIGEYICLDPGHGGPEASQYGCNGWGYNQNAGSYGPVYQLSEQWVNLQVALECSTLLDEMGQFYNIRMTRRTEQAENCLQDF
jgi:N-acetylmuramoyl-L-alanine amidase